MSRQTLIREIYAGKPDAKDEIFTTGLTDFVNSYVVPDNFDIEKVINDDYYYISGYKGTGKTALLFYTDNYIKQKDHAACSSFIFFKEEYPENKRQELELLSKRLISSITIGDDVLLEGNDYEYIWRWLLLKRIVEDNEHYSRGLFVDDDNWMNFERQILQIKGNYDKKRFVMPSKIKISIPVTNSPAAMTIKPELEIDFTKSVNPEAFQKFIEIVDSAECSLECAIRTNVPYYVFIDELEAYYGDEKIFHRDLCLIRDLVITVRRINGYFVSSKRSTKIICSIRTEIMNAISRFIIPKEINKIILGFESPLVWDYSNTNSFAHPIMRIFLKRIRMAENSNENYCDDYRNIYKKWFPELINGQEPANYILNNGWNKPRDIVRFIRVAQNCLFSSSTAFTKAVFSACQKRYSLEGLVEIKEEMRALYSPEQIESIVSCFTGFRTLFTIDELVTRVNTHDPDSIMSTYLNRVIRDLYRFGFLGNYSPGSMSYRWQHKADDGLIISAEWSIIIHPALHAALSISKRHDRGMQFAKKERPKVNEIFKVVVKNILSNKVIVEFKCNDISCTGVVHIDEMPNACVSNNQIIVPIESSHAARVLGCNLTDGSWVMTFKI